MYILVILIGLITVTEIIWIGIGVNVLFILIARALFLFKLMGMDVKIGWPVGFDLAAIFMTLVWRVVWKKQVFEGDMIVLIVAFLLTFILMMYDAFMYVYIEEDDYDYVKED